MRCGCHAWDFGGQQIYHATHQFFLTNRSLFLLLWNSRLGWEQGKLRYWLDIITARAPESPILLVATHVGDRPVDLPLYELRQRVSADRRRACPIDNAAREGIDELRDRLAEQAAELPLMGSEWPTKWLAAARGGAQRAGEARHAGEDVGADGRRRCPRPNLRQYIAVALHELGDILYYGRTRSCRETVVLQPGWVNEYISMVLDSDQVATAHGLLTRSHLNELWADLDRGLRNHFLGMMDKYDLSYRIQGGRADDVSLVVERLQWDPPDFHVRVGRDRESREHPGDQGPVPAQHHAARHSDVVHRTVAPVQQEAALADRRTARPRRRATPGARPCGHPPQHRRAGRARADARRFFSVLDDGLNLTLERFPGLQITRQVPCRCEVRLCRSCSTTRTFAARLARTPPKDMIECRKSAEDVSVPELLLGLAPSERDTARMSMTQMANMLTQISDRVEEQGDLRAADVPQDAAAAPGAAGSTVPQRLRDRADQEEARPAAPTSYACTARNPARGTGFRNRPGATRSRSRPSGSGSWGPTCST